jgi:hypothetical protein
MNSLNDTEVPRENKAPGGRIGFGEPSNDLKPFIIHWQELLDGDVWGFSCMRDPDFVRAFIDKIPDPQEQDNFVINTAKYLSHESSDYDPSHVLLFRRSLPSDIPKPEAHWTGDYISARNGLHREIPGEHRLYTIILCSTLETLSQAGFAEANAASTDEEVKIKPEPFDQQKCLLSFRPTDQQKQLDTYMTMGPAVTLRQLLDELKRMKEKS